MTDAVAARVLRGSYTQTQSLSLARAQAPAMLDVHDRFMRELESAGRLDRALEALPDSETVADRRTANQGLTQPELAVILAYSKITLYAALLDSDLPEDPALGAELERYFPAPLPERFGDEMAAHRLRREIVATRVTNDLVDRAGTTFVFRLGEDTGAAPADIARASIVARDVFSVRALWNDIEALDGQVGGRRPVRHAARVAAGWSSGRRAGCCARGRGRWTSRPRSSATRTARGWSATCCRTCSSSPSRSPGASACRSSPSRACRRRSPGAWRRRARCSRRSTSSRSRARPSHDLEEVARLHFLLGGKLHLHWLRDRIALLARDTRWAAMARAALRDDLFSLHAELTADVLRFELARRVAGGATVPRSNARRRSSARSAPAARST